MEDIKKTIIATRTLEELLERCESIATENELLKQENEQFKFIIKRSEPSESIQNKIDKFLEN